MRRTSLGNADLTRIGLGTNRLTNSAANVAFVKQAVAAGIQMIDTAHLYTGGQSEETIGAALSPFPAGCVVATKGGFEPGHGRPEILSSEIEQSLGRLRTDRISLYYLHRVDPETPLEESLAVIKDYRDRGRIEHVGISQVDVHQVERARKVVPIAAVQNLYNLEERKHDPVLDYCDREGILFVPFFPLRAGASDSLARVAGHHRATPQQVMLAWLLHRSPGVLPIPGTLSIGHVKENLAALELALNEAELRALG